MYQSFFLKCLCGRSSKSDLAINEQSCHSDGVIKRLFHLIKEKEDQAATSKLEHSLFSELKDLPIRIIHDIIIEEAATIYEFEQTISRTYMHLIDIVGSDKSLREEIHSRLENSDNQAAFIQLILNETLLHSVGPTNLLPRVRIVTNPFSIKLGQQKITLEKGMYIYGNVGLALAAQFGKVEFRLDRSASFYYEHLNSFGTKGALRSCPARGIAQRILKEIIRLLLTQKNWQKVDKNHFLFTDRENKN